MSTENICPVCDGEMVYQRKVDGTDLVVCLKCDILKTLSPFDNDSNYKNLGYDYRSYTSNDVSYRSRFEEICRKLREFKRDGSKLLDIGGGFGLFSLVASEYYRVDCLEPTLPCKYLEDSKDVKVVKKTLEKFILSTTDKYDVVTLLDVFEHFPDPNEKLETVSNLLDREGILVIQCPNYKSIMQYVCRDWSWWMISDHRYHYSYKSLVKLLNRNNFYILYSRTYEDINDFKKNLDGNFSSISNDFIRKFVKLVFFSFFTPVYILFRHLIWQFKFGGITTIYAKKNS